MRRNAEQIAFARAVPGEWRRLGADFAALFRNFRLTQIAFAFIGFVTGIWSMAGTVLPIFLVLPKYFAGRVSVGEIMQTRNGFGAFSMSLSWFVQSYATIAIVAASANRIRALDEALLVPLPDGIAQHRGGNAVATAGLVLSRPDGSPLAHVGD